MPIQGSVPPICCGVRHEHWESRPSVTPLTLELPMAAPRIASFAVAVALAVGLAGCSTPDEESAGSSGDSASESAAPADEPSSGDKPSKDEPVEEKAGITITDFEFEGPTSVAPGTEVTVENSDRSTHSATSGDDSFTEVIVEGDASETFTAPMEPGEYEYVCKFHPEMTATLVVE